MAEPGYISLYIRPQRGHSGLVLSNPLLNQIKNNFSVPLLISLLCQKHLPGQTLLTFSLDSVGEVQLMNINKCGSLRWEGIKLFPSI